MLRKIPLEDRSQKRFVQSAVDIKRWLEETPKVEAVRPARCPSCGAAGQPHGGEVVVRGHGVRDRQLRGPPEPGVAPAVIGVVVRRYRCGRCRAVLTVVPRGIVRKRLYGASAIGWALALFGLCGLPPGEVRGRVSPWRIASPAGWTSWPQLRRWVHAVRDKRLFHIVRAPPADFTLREVAARAATTLAAHAEPDVRSRPLDVQTFYGAAHAA